MDGNFRRQRYKKINCADFVGKGKKKCGKQKIKTNFYDLEFKRYGTVETNISDLFYYIGFDTPTACCGFISQKLPVNL